MDEVPVSTPGHGPRAHVSRTRFVFGKTTSLIELLSRESNVGCYYSCFVSRELQPIGLFLMMFHLFISKAGETIHKPPLWLPHQNRFQYFPYAIIVNREIYF